MESLLALVVAFALLMAVGTVALGTWADRRHRWEWDRLQARVDAKNREVDEWNRANPDRPLPRWTIEV